MRVSAEPSALSAEFPPISPKRSLEGKAPPESNSDVRKDNISPHGEAKHSASTLSLPPVEKKSTRATPSASTSASPSPSPSPSSLKDSEEHERLRSEPVGSKGGTEHGRLLLDDAIYKGETCSVHVCGTKLKISSPNGELALIPFREIVARFEQDQRRVVCSLLDWEFFMLSSVCDVERVWRLELDWGQALSFRKQLEKLGVVQTDLCAQFNFKRHIGKGAFSEVYLAQHLETKTAVAAKVMKKPVGYADYNVDNNVWEDFAKEVSILAKAQGHESILRLHAAYLFRTNDREGLEGACTLAMITEHLEITLLDLVKKNGKLPEAATRGVTESLLQALAHLNSVGMVHRDIKVSNVMVRSLERGGIVLVDYGFGRAVGAPEVFRNVVGTVGYLAPELFIEDAYIDLRYADVFSVGIVAMTCLIGRSVFQGRGKDGTATDRAKYFENQKCDLDWGPPADNLTTEGLDAMKRLLEADPTKRPLAAEALRSPWFDLPPDACVAGSVPAAAAAELAYLTTPRARRAEKKPSQKGDAPDAPALRPTAPPVTPPPDRRPRRSPPTGRRQVESGSSSSAIAVAAAA